LAWGEVRAEKIDFWDNVYGFDMSCIRQLAMSEPLVDNVDPEQVVTQSALLHTFDLSSMERAEADFSVRAKP
jgi:type I protein arginine methyltransferase